MERAVLTNEPTIFPEFMTNPDANTQPKTPTSNEISVVGKQAIEAINEAIKCMNDYESIINYQEGKIDELQTSIDKLEAVIDEKVAIIESLGRENYQRIQNNVVLLDDIARLTNANSALTQEIERLNRLVHINTNAGLLANNETLRAENHKLRAIFDYIKTGFKDLP